MMDQSQMNAAMADYGNSLHQQQATANPYMPLPSLPKIDSIEFTAGRSYWRTIRDFVSKARFNGYNVEMWEGEGWMSHGFLIRGDGIVIQALRKWAKEMAGGS